MKWRLFSIAAVLSCVLGAGVAASWLRSYWVYDQISCGSALDRHQCAWKSYSASFQFPRWPPGIPEGGSVALLTSFGKVLLQRAVSRNQLRELSALFMHYLLCVLSEEGFTERTKNKILSEYAEVVYAPSNNWRVLGSMNDLAFHYKYHVLESGGVHSPDVPGIIRKLNRMPMGAIGYRFPIEALSNLYETAT